MKIARCFASFVRHACREIEEDMELAEFIDITQAVDAPNMTAVVTAKKPGYRAIPNKRRAWRCVVNTDARD